VQLLDACDGIEIDLYTSNESIQSQAEYIRDGLNWNQWVSNMEFLMQSGKLRGLHVMNTINALCLDSLPSFLSQCMQWKEHYGQDFPNFTLNILRFPSFQSPLVLPDEIRMQYKTDLENWLEHYCDHPMLQPHESYHTQRLIDYLDVVKTPHSDSFDMPRLHNDFKQFYSQYDARRNKNFIETFPRLQSWYNSI
jgi:hypothetical protein